MTVHVDGGKRLLLEGVLFEEGRRRRALASGSVSRGMLLWGELVKGVNEHPSGTAQDSSAPPFGKVIKNVALTGPGRNSGAFRAPLP